MTPHAPEPFPVEAITQVCPCGAELEVADRLSNQGIAPRPPTRCPHCRRLIAFNAANYYWGSSAARILASGGTIR